MSWGRNLFVLSLLCLATPAWAQLGCVPNPNATAPPFVDGCSLPAAGLNRLASPLAPSNWTSTQTFLNTGTSAQILIGGNPYIDWLNSYSYGTNRTNIVSLAPAGGGAITGASRTSTSLGGSTAAIGLMGWGFTDATGTLAAQPAWGAYAECRSYPSSTGFCAGMELDITNLTGVLRSTLPYNVAAAGANYGLHIAAGGGCGTNAKCFDPANGLNDLAANFPASAALLISGNGLGSSNNIGILFQDQGINGADGTDTGGGGIAIAMARGQAINWYATGNVQRFHFASVAKTTDQAGTMLWDSQGIEIQNGTGSGPNIFTLNPGPGTAVNGFMFAAANTGVGPAIQAQGSDTNIDIQLVPKGASGGVALPNTLTGTPVASLCLDASNHIIKKTTAGSCI